MIILDKISFPRSFFLVTLLFLSLIYSCNQGEIERLRVQNDSLLTSKHQNDSTFQKLISTFITVESNLNSIRKKEAKIQQQISNNKLEKNGKDSIIAFMDDIDNLSQTNKMLVTKLEKEIDTLPLQVKGMGQMVVGLKEKSNLQNKEVDDLKGKLTTIHRDFRKLFEEYVTTEVSKMELSEQNMRLDHQNIKLQKANQQLREELNSGWYATGTKNELKAKKLVNTKGILLSNSLSENLDKSEFVKIDIRNFHSLDLFVKKARLISKHPPETYEITGNKKIAKKLLIKDPVKFWSVSKFLLIELEP